MLVRVRASDDPLATMQALVGKHTNIDIMYRAADCSPKLCNRRKKGVLIFGVNNLPGVKHDRNVFRVFLTTHFTGSFSLTHVDISTQTAPP